MKNLLKYLPLLFTIATALIGYSWVVATAYGRVIAVETTVNGMPERLARIEERVIALNDKLDLAIKQFNAEVVVQPGKKEKDL